MEEYSILTDQGLIDAINMTAPTTDFLKSVSSGTLEEDLLRTLFANSTPTIRDTVIYISLFTADGEGYPGYERQSVPRDLEHWEIGTDGNGHFTATNKKEILFPQCTGGSAMLTHFGLYVDGTLWRKDPLEEGLGVNSIVTPMFGPNDLKISLDSQFY